MAPRSRSVTLGVDVVASDKNASSTLRGTRQEVGGLGEALDDAAVKAASFWAVYQGGGKLKEAALAASSLKEMRATSEQVFGDSSDHVREFAANAADAFGQSEAAALEANNAYGGILKNMGMTREESSKWAVELSKRASDLAAAWDTEVPDALAAIQSGLSGQTEPLRRYGMDLTHASLEQDALALGLDRNITNLSRAERAQVLYTSIMRQSSDAAGQFAREKNGLNQKIARATAEAENAKAAFGESLMPIFGALADAVRIVAGGFSDLPGPIRTGIAMLSAAGVAAGGVTLAVGILGPALTRGWAGLVKLGVGARKTALDLIVPEKALTRLTVAQDRAAASSGRLAGGMGRAGTAAKAGGVLVGVAALAFTVWQSHAEKTRQRAEELEAAVTSLRGEVEATGDSLAEVFDRDKLLPFVAEWRDELDQAGITLEEVRAALTGTDEDLQVLLDRAQANPGIWENVWRLPGEAPKDSLSGFREALAALVEQYEGAEEEIADYARATEDLGIAQDDTTTSTEGQASATRDLRREVESLSQVVQRRLADAHAQIDLERSLEEAQRESLLALHELHEARAGMSADSEGMRSALAGVEDAQRGVADAERAAADARRGVVESMEAVRDAQERLSEARREATQRIIEQMQAAREAATAEAGAAVALDRARKELQRTESSGASELERREAAQKVREAEDALAASTLTRTQEAEKAARAQRDGVEGDQAVIDAKRAVVDAQDGVREANERVIESDRRVREEQKRVGEAQRRVSEVRAEASKRVEDATRRVEQAVLDEARAAGEQKTKTEGATAGYLEQLGVLERYAGAVGPGSSIYERIRAFQSLIAGEVTEGGRVVSGQQSLAAAEARLGSGRGGTGLTVHVHGSGVETQRRARDMIQDAVSSVFRGG